MSDDKDYSLLTSLNSDFAEFGTEDDVKCNIFDMASNCYEWTTETGNKWPCVYRGGTYERYVRSYFTSSRDGMDDTYYTEECSFRAIIYL